MLTASMKVSVKETGKGAPLYSINSDLAGEVTLEALFKHLKETLIIIADQTLREAQVNGFTKKPILVVDNSASKPLEQVSPVGKIQFIAQVQSSKLLLDAYDAIESRTRVVSGTYKKYNWVAFNGSIVATSKPSFEAWLKVNSNFKYQDRIRFINFAPYAARLERLGVRLGKVSPRKKTQKKDRLGANGGAKFSSTLANGAYTLAAREIRRKYKYNSGIYFQFKFGDAIGAFSAALPGRAGGTHYQGGALKGKPYLYPTILISLKDIGLTDSDVNKGIL